MTEVSIFDTRYSGRKSGFSKLENGEFILIDKTRTHNGILTLNLNNTTTLDNTTNFKSDTIKFSGNSYNNIKKDNGALEAHYNSGLVYDYFFKRHNRKSYDDKDGTIKNYIHFSNGYNQAFYNPGTGYKDPQFVYGDGDGLFLDVPTSIDIIGHEFTHAMIDYTCQLVYAGEHGSINEGICDIFGFMCNRFKNGETDFSIGGDIDVRVNATRGLRRFDNPEICTDPQPKMYGGKYWMEIKSTDEPTSANDYLHVHVNSGPILYWFYLLGEGGTGTNENNYSFDVSGIGFDKSAQIVYRAMTKYLHKTSVYGEMREATENATIDLYGNNNELVSVQEAWDAINVQKDQGGFTFPDVVWEGNDGNDRPKFRCSTGHSQRLENHKPKEIKIKTEKRIVSENPYIPKQVIRSPKPEQKTIIHVHTSEGGLIKNIEKEVSNKFNMIEKIHLGGDLKQQGRSSIAIGGGSRSQGDDCIAIGKLAGETQIQSIAIGKSAGQFNQSKGIAIGNSAGKENQSKGIAIGNSAGQVNQGVNSVSIGNSAGQVNQGVNSVSIGHVSDSCFDNSIVLNGSGHKLTSKTESIYINPIRESSEDNLQYLRYNPKTFEITKNTDSPKIGPQGPIGIQGQTGSQGPTGIQGILGSIGPTGPRGVYTRGRNSGDYLTWDEKLGEWVVGKSIKIGKQSGYNSLSMGNISIGDYSGKNNQGSDSVSIGHNTGENNQSKNSVAIGNQSGRENQGEYSVAIGNKAGLLSIGSNSVAIGNKAGLYNVGQNCITIGSNINIDKKFNKVSNSICLNNSDQGLNMIKSDSLYISNISETTNFDGFVQLYYNPITKEVAFGKKK